MLRYTHIIDTMLRELQHLLKFGKSKLCGSRFVEDQSKLLLMYQLYTLIIQLVKKNKNLLKTFAL